MWPKTFLDRPLLTALLKRGLGYAVVPRQVTELTGGTYNAAYHVVLDQAAVVVKVAPSPSALTLRYEREAMRVEAQALRLAQAHTRVRVPQLLGVEFSRTLIPCDALVMSVLPGQPLDRRRPQLSRAAQAGVDHQIGRQLRALHAATSPVFGHLLDPGRQSPSWRTALTTLIEDVLQDARDAGVAVPAVEVRTALATHAPLLDQVTCPSLLLWDSWDGNIFVDVDSGDRPEVTGFTDFERALWGDPLAESQFLLRREHPALIEGYGQNLLSTDEDRLRRALYDLHLLLVMTVECTYRALGPESYEAWARQKLKLVLAELLE